MKKHSVTHWLTIGTLLLVYLYTRLYHLMLFPLFVDESFHIETAQHVWSGHVLSSANHGRLLRVWLNALLGPDAPSAGWITRTGTVLIGMLGIAAFYALVTAIVSHTSPNIPPGAAHRAGVVGMLLWIMMPYLLFYERLALADPLLSSLSVVAVWMAWLTVKHPTRRAALRLGLASAILLLAKAPGIVWLPLPAVTLLLVTGITWRKRVSLGVIVYSTWAMLWLPLFSVLRLKRYNYFGLAGVFVEGVNDGVLARIGDNLTDVWRYDVTYLGWPILILAIFGGLYWLWRDPRSALLALVALGVGVGGPVIFGRNINSRYVLNHVAWVLLPLVVGTALFIQRVPRARWIIYGSLLIWAGGFYGPFQMTLWHNPDELHLTGNDRREYIQGEASGYAVTEIGKHLRELERSLPTLGLVANCNTLQLAAYPTEVVCPQIKWDGTSQNTIMSQAEEWARGTPIYLVGENLPYIILAGIPQPNELLFSIQRPGHNSAVNLYLIYQGAKRP